MASVKWRPRAIQDIERLHEFLVNKNEESAKKAAYVIFKAAELLETSPQIGRPLLDGTRRRELTVPFGVGTYVIRYFLHENTVVIVRVWHSHEDRK